MRYEPGDWVVLNYACMGYGETGIDFGPYIVEINKIINPETFEFRHYSSYIPNTRKGYGSSEAKFTDIVCKLHPFDVKRLIKRDFE